MFLIYEYDEYSDKEYPVKTVYTLKEVHEYAELNCKVMKCTEPQILGLLDTNYWSLEYKEIK